MERQIERATEYQRICRDRVRLKSQLEDMKKRVSFLQTEALLHQINLRADSHGERFLIPTSLDSDVSSKCTEMMSGRAALLGRASISGVSSAKVSARRAVGFTKEPEFMPPPAKQFKRQREEEWPEDTDNDDVVYKTYKAEGTIGDIAYAAVFVARKSAGSEAEKVTALQDFRLGTQSSVAKSMLTPARVTRPDTVHCFTSNLYYHKVLSEGRKEALSYIESKCSGVEVEEHSEPVVVKLRTHGNHEVEVVWQLLWDDRNNRFKYRIKVNCDEEVLTRYSTSEVYPYLSGRETLETSQDFKDFAEVFTDL